MSWRIGRRPSVARQQPPPRQNAQSHLTSDQRRQALQLEYRPLILPGAVALSDLLSARHHDGRPPWKRSIGALTDVSSALWDIRSASTQSSATNKIRLLNKRSQKLGKWVEGGLYTHSRGSSQGLIAELAVICDSTVHTSSLPSRVITRFGGVLHGHKTSSATRGSV